MTTFAKAASWRSRRESDPPHPVDSGVASPDAYEIKTYILLVLVQLLQLPWSCNKDPVQPLP